MVHFKRVTRPSNLDSFFQRYVFHLKEVTLRVLFFIFFPLKINKNCETKVWLIMILMITKQSLELMIIFQV